MWRQARWWMLRRNTHLPAGNRGLPSVRLTDHQCEILKPSSGEQRKDRPFCLTNPVAFGPFLVARCWRAGAREGGRICARGGGAVSPRRRDRSRPRRRGGGVGAVGAGGFTITARDRGDKTVFLSHLYIKMMILPRQARDKHRENSKKDRFVAAFERWACQSDVRPGTG